MPWALVATVPTARGTFWLKANDAAFRHEAELLERLNAGAPDTVVVPLARHRTEGWFLTADGGETADVAASPPKDGEIIDAYLRAQRAGAEITDELIQTGVPMIRSDELVSIFDRAVAHPLAGPAAERCAPLRPAVVERCRLVAKGPLAITNTDLKPSHVFAGPPARLFDWGDAVLAHPLLSSGTIQRAIGDDALARYLAAWNDRPDSPAATGAATLDPLLRLGVWLRAPDAALDRYPEQVNNLLARLADNIFRHS